MAEHSVELLLPDGKRQTVLLTVSYPDSAADPDFYEVTLELGGVLSGRSPRGVFFALQELRKHLDARRILLNCCGASEDVYPSPMMEDMGPSILGYRTRIGEQALRRDIVDIFACDALVRPATVEQQEGFHRRWLDGFRR